MKEKTKIIKRKTAKAKETVKKTAKKAVKAVKKLQKKAVKRGVAKQYTFKPLVRTLELLDINAAELARLFPCDQSFVSKWLNEVSKVPLRFAIKIEELTAGKIKAKAISPELYAEKAKKEKVLAKLAKKLAKKVVKLSSNKE